MASNKGSASAVLALVLAAALSWVPGEAAAQQTAPLVVFFAPSDSLPGVKDVREALDRAASARGTALIDLSPPALPSPTAASALRRAIDSYHEFSYADALAEIDAALAEAGQTGGDGLRPVELADLYVYRALVLTAQGDATRAWSDFVRAATLDSTRKLDPARFSPGVVSSFERAAAAVSSGPRTQLSVDVADGCNVAVDGRTLPTKEARDVARGEHYLRVECPNSIPYGSRFVADRDSQTLTPSISAISLPSDQRLRKEGRLRSATSVLAAQVTPGTANQVTLTVRLLRVADGKERSRAMLRLGRATDGQRAEAAVRTILDQAVAPTPTPAVGQASRQPTAWYQQPWVWGTVGVAITAAVLLPFVFDGNGATTGFDVVPEGIP